jgi:CubicO group peptidase (beta-lactamase class C family)
MRWLSCLFLVLNCSSCYLIRAYRVRDFQLTDHQRLPSVIVAKSDRPYYFADGTRNEQYRELGNYLDTTLPKSFTAAFLVIKNDSIIYENYFNGFTQSSLLPSFSVAKSFVATLVSIALAEGRIKSLQEPVTNYLPELYKKDKNFSKITIQHLLDMKSGLLFNEGSYGLKDDAIKLGFRPNLLKHALKVKVEKEPGGKFNYQSINTELLALVVERASGKKISAYLQEKLWQPLGAEYNATWNVDSKKHRQEIAFAGLNAAARDFAKLGKLYLNGGQWRGENILLPLWVQTVNNADSMNRAGGYKNQWWSSLNYRFFADSAAAQSFKNKTPYATSVRKTTRGYRVAYRTDAFSAEGIFNQYIYINPRNNVVIVRLGRFWYHPEMYAEQFVYQIGEQL